LPEEAEIEMLIRKAKRGLDAAHYLLREGFYEDAVNRAITVCTLQQGHYF